MKHFIIISVFILMLGEVCHSQTLKQVTKNVLSINIVAFTYSTELGNSTAKDTDVKTTAFDVSLIFLSFKGVTRASLDKATGLITVIGNLQTNLPEIILPRQLIKT